MRAGMDFLEYRRREDLGFHKQGLLDRGEESPNGFLKQSRVWGGSDGRIRRWGLGLSNFQFHLPQLGGFFRVRAGTQFTFFEKVSPSELPVF